MAADSSYYLTPAEIETTRLDRPKAPPYEAYSKLLREILKTQPVSLSALHRTLRGHWDTLVARDLYARSKKAVAILNGDKEGLRIPGERLKDVLAELDQQKKWDEMDHF